MTFKSFTSRRAALLATSASMVLAGVASASAQDADDEESVEEVVVTGSRIIRTDLAAVSPVTVVGAVDLELSNTVNTEQFLNTLPQAIPGLDGSSNNPGAGEATVDLRGLGEARTLVLVNGRRWVSSRTAGIVDLNTIPSSLVKQVDVVTGGASAVYGSDAVAGVVNFVLKDDFEGVEINSSLELTDQGDGEIFNISAIVGGNFADGKGNAVLQSSYTRREAVFQGDREETTFSLVDNGPELGLQRTGSVGVPGGLVFGSLDLTALGLDTPVNGACALEDSVPSADGTFCTNDQGAFIFNPSGPGVSPHIGSGPNTTTFNYAPFNYLQLPQERWNITALATYDINDDLEVYTRLVYSKSSVNQELAPTPYFGSVTINLDNPFLDAQTVEALRQQGVGDADGNGVEDATVFVGRRFLEGGSRIADNQNDALQIAMGLRGNLTENWNFDLYGHFNQSNWSDIQSGNISRSAWEREVRENRLNLFERGGISDDVVETVSRTGAIIGQAESFNASLDISGEVVGIKSPWADLPVAVAVGAEYREETYRQIPDSVLGPDVSGFLQSPATAGEFHNVDFYAEVQAPIIQDKTFAKELSINGAFRYSDYSTVGSTESYSVGLSWTPVDDIRFRAQYQRAVRAPNITDLFAPQTNSFPAVQDPCSTGRGRFNDLTAAEQDAARQNCIANGVPADRVGSALQLNGQIESLVGGNPDLFEESADTYTIGVVISPSFVEGLNITVDYYDITVEDVIATVPNQTLFDDCFLLGNQNFCDQITRFPNGVVDIFNAGAVNAAELTRKGVDIAIDYNFDIGDLGTIGIYSLLTYVDEANFLPFEGADLIECAGIYGSNCGEPIPEWKANTRVDWTYGRLTTRLRWNYIDTVDDFDAVNGGANLFIPSVGNKNYVDLSFFYDLNETVSFSAGVKNLFDTDFVFIGDSAAQQSNTFPATYETLGQQYFFGAKFKF